MRNQRGFTLIELLLVIAILAVLMFIAAPVIAGTVQTARERACDSNVRMLDDAILRYHADRVAAGAQTDLWPWERGAHSGDAIARDSSWNGSMVKEGFMESLGAPPRCPFGGEYRAEFFRADNGAMVWRVWCSGCPDGRERHGGE